MASKPIYLVVAAVGIATASGAAWWYQNKAGRPAPTDVSAAVATAGVGAGTGASVGGGGRSSAGGSGGSAGTGGPAGAASGASRPPAVEVARVELARLSDDAQAVGSLRSRQSVVLKPEVSGRVTQLNFRDGERVRRGQLLVQLDDQLQQAQVQQSQAELSIATANNKRNQELVAQNFISQRSVDESAANLQVAEAKLSLARATAARLRIVAPFDGIAGIRTVNIGDYLKDGAEIVNIEDLDAVFVDFRLPERFQAKVQRGQTALVTMDSLPGRQYTAVVQAIDPLVDANGRSVGIRGCIDNRRLELRPGMFARITAVFAERNDARVIPEEAIVPQGGRQFVIKLVDGADQDSRITQRVEVKVGIRQPGKVEITDGLQIGDTVVTAGQQRIQKDGTPVRVTELGGPANGVRPGGPVAPASAVSSASSASPASPASSASSASSATSSVISPAAGNPARAAAAKPVGPNPCGIAAVPSDPTPRGATAGRPTAS